jgi:5-methylcytosine-specific restriction endonuclease McrA
MQRPVTAKQLLAIVEDQGYKCALSGVELTPETASLDHIVPMSKGGTHTIENVWIVDRRVNGAKGTMTTEEFISLCRAVVKHNKETE